MVQGFITDEQGQAIIKDGDFVVGDSTRTHKRRLLVFHPGVAGYAPLTGVGIADFSLDDQLTGLGQRITEQFERDGMVVRNVEVRNGVVNENASYR